MNSTHGSVGRNDYDIKEYFSHNKITEETKGKLDSTDILILPYKYNEDFYFADESVAFLKYCKQYKQENNIDILADSERIEVRSLNSFDIWMPLIWVANVLLLPVTVNLVSDYISDRRRGREKEACQVDISFKVQDGDKIKELHYKGDAESFREKFEKIDINNL